MSEATVSRETSCSMLDYLRPSTANRAALGRAPRTQSSALLELHSASELRTLGAANGKADDGSAQLDEDQGRLVVSGRENHVGLSHGEGSRGVNQRTATVFY